MDKPRFPRMEKRPPIDQEQWKSFLTFLSPHMRLIAETYKFATEVYAEIGLSYTLKELLFLPASSIKAYPPLIQLDRASLHCSNGELGYDRHLPHRSSVTSRLVALAQSRPDPNGFLFCQNNGSPISDSMVAKAFKKASRESGITITPKCLRVVPREDIWFERGITSSIHFHKGSVPEVSPEKVRQIDETLRSGLSNAGRPRKHSLADILKVLVVQRDFGFTRSECVKHFPILARAAESQRRMWVQWGIWDHILSILDH